MNLTISPISFNGQLDNALERKDSLLKLKQKNLQSQQALLNTAQTEMGNLAQEKTDSLTKAEDNIKVGKFLFDRDVNTATEKLEEGEFQAQKTHTKGQSSARTVLVEAQKKTDSLVQQLREMAVHADELQAKSKQNLAEIGKTAKPLRNAAKTIEKGNIAETKEVAESVGSAIKAVDGAKKALAEALEEVANLEQKERETITEQRQTAIDKRTEATNTKKTDTKKNQDAYKAKLVELAEQKAQAIDNAKEAYRTQVNEAQEALQEYTDLAGADMEKADKLQKQINDMKKSVLKIRVQALYTKATNLPNLAAATVGLGALGENATSSVTGRIIGTLKKFDWLATVKGKLSAIDAADIFLQKGSDNQQIVMGTGIEMNANKIVDRTKSLEVVDSLRDLAKQINTLNLEA